MTQHLTSHGRPTIVTSDATGAVSLDLSTGSIFVLTLTGNVTALAFTNAPTDGAEVEVHFVQDATGSRLLSGVDGAINLGGALTLTTAAGKRDILVFTAIGDALYEKSRSMAVTA